MEFIRVHAYIHTYIHTCMHAYLDTHTYIDTYMHICLFILTHTHPFTHTRALGSWTYNRLEVCQNENSGVYYIGHSSTDFNGALNYCENNGDTLAIIKSAEDQSRAAAACGGYSCWIGLLEEGGMWGTWGWIDGESLSYSNWQAGQPNNHEGNDEKHAIMNCCSEYADHGSDGKWYDAPESHYGPRALCLKGSRSDDHSDSDGQSGK